MSKVSVIGIAGGSCSGKTRLLRKLAALLGPQNAAVMLQDDYYFSKPDAQKDNLKFNFDHPEAIDFDLLCGDLTALKQGRSIESPHYDFAQHVRVPGRYKPVQPRPVVLVDGILILTHRPLLSVFDYALYISCDAETRLQRRIARDVAQRGRERKNVIAQFQTQVQPMHDEFVEPSRLHADEIIEQGALMGDATAERLHLQLLKMTGLA